MIQKKRSFHEVWQKDKIIWMAIGTLAILFIPTSLIHESGHILVCVSNGFNYTFYVESFIFNVQCSNTPQPIELYWALGGIFGSLASLGLLLSKRIRDSKGVFVGVIVTAFDHFQKTLFETFTHSAYLSNHDLTIFMSAIDLVFMAILLWFFGYRPKKIT